MKKISEVRRQRNMEGNVLMMGLGGSILIEQDRAGWLAVTNSLWVGAEENEEVQKTQVGVILLNLWKSVLFIDLFLIIFFCYY